MVKPKYTIESELVAAIDRALELAPAADAMDDIATCGEISCDECNLRTQALRARIAELETELRFFC